MNVEEPKTVIEGNEFEQPKREPAPVQRFVSWHLRIIANYGTTSRVARFMDQSLLCRKPVMLGACSDCAVALGGVYLEG